MKETTLVIGGCRSGKSRYALKAAEHIPAQKRVFIATCIPRDKEMKQRVLLHQKERSQSWTTLEVPILLPEAIIENDSKDSVIIVDCLTLWLSNIILENNDAEIINAHIQKLSRSLDKTRSPVILVSNEVGTGIVPENQIARIFRDTAGYLNQQAATCCNQVFHVVAGIAISIKSPGTQ